jgi:hypothetical protein
MNELVDNAKQVLDRIHANTRAKPKQVLADLKDVRDHVDLLIDAMECSLYGTEDEAE